MAVVLTQAEIDSLTEELLRLRISVSNRTSSANLQQDLVDDATNADSAEKKAFDLYDIDIIRNYEDEREQLDGTYIDQPALKSELDLVGQLDATNRMYPTLPQTEPIRISQFDGTPLITTDNEIPGYPSDLPTDTVLDTEPYWIARQAEREDWLVNGLGGTSPTLTSTVKVVTAITPVTTQITIETTDPNEAPSFSVGDRFVVYDGSDQVAIEIINVVSEVAGNPLGSCSGEDNPPQTTEAACLADNGTWDSNPVNFAGVYDILVLIPGSTAGNSDIDELWSGFNNTDRTNKVDATDGYTNLLLAMIEDLEDMIDNRITKLSNQQISLGLNEDTLLDPQALIDVNAAVSTLTTWKSGTAVDDTSLATLSAERIARSSQISARIPAIEAAKAVYYNDRYERAVNIADTSRGTARIKFFRIDSQGVTSGLGLIEQERIDAIEDLFTLAGVPIP